MGLLCLSVPLHIRQRSDRWLGIISALGAQILAGVWVRGSHLCVCLVCPMSSWTWLFKNMVLLGPCAPKVPVHPQNMYREALSSPKNKLCVSSCYEGGAGQVVWSPGAAIFISKWKQMLLLVKWARQSENLLSH